MSPVFARPPQPAPTDPSLRIVPVRNQRDLDEFIRVPNRLYRGCPSYVPALLKERRDALSMTKNPYFRHAKAQYWLAWWGNEVVGRISAQIDDLYIARYQNATGHFGFLDADDDPRIFQALTATAEDWLRSRGMRRILGPFNLSINEECGLLVDGFDSLAVMMMGFTLPYAGQRLTEQGYTKAMDLVAYDYNVQRAAAVGKDLLDRVKNDPRVRLRTMDSSRYHEDLAVILDIFNEAWSENWGFVPFSEAEMEHVAQSMRPLIRREMVWIAEVDGLPVAMIVCLPNLCEAIAGLDGKLLPFGWLKLLWRLKVRGLKTGRVVMMGLRRAHHGSPLGAALVLLLIEALRTSTRRLGFERIELSWILEDNRRMRSIIESIQARVYKTYRIYEKALS